MLKFFKMLVGMVLLPMCWAVSMAVYSLYRNSVDPAAGGFAGWALPIGFLLWIALFFLLPRPFRTYVLGHELTHAMWALMMGGRVGKMKVGKEGGHVEVSKSNFLITLAPYFFPFYTFIVIALYFLASIWLEVEAYRAWWLGAVGFTWAFHVTFTIHMLAQRQPDVQEHGKIFSYAVIYLMNVLLIGIWMVLVGSPRFGQFGELLAGESKAAYIQTYQACTSAYTFAEKRIRQAKK